MGEFKEDGLETDILAEGAWRMSPEAGQVRASVTKAGVFHAV